VRDVTEEIPPKPLRFDNQPRFLEFSCAAEPNEKSLYWALEMLRPLAQARGYTNRPIEFFDVILVGSERWIHRFDELKKQLPGLQTQLVSPMVLKTEGAWALIFGVDSVISLVPW